MTLGYWAASAAWALVGFFAAYLAVRYVRRQTERERR